MNLDVIDLLVTGTPVVILVAVRLIRGDRLNQTLTHATAGIRAEEYRHVVRQKLRLLTPGAHATTAAMIAEWRATDCLHCGMAPDLTALAAQIGMRSRAGSVIHGDHVYRYRQFSPIPRPSRRRREGEGATVIYPAAAPEPSLSRVVGLAGRLADRVRPGTAREWSADPVPSARWALDHVRATVRIVGAAMARKAWRPVRAGLCWVLRSELRTWLPLTGLIVWAGIESTTQGPGVALLVMASGYGALLPVVAHLRRRLGVQVPRASRDTGTGSHR